MKNRIACFIVATLLLALTLWATACGSTSAEAGTRSPKYTITVDDFNELLPDPKLSAEREYQLLRIPLEDDRFELVSTSLVEIEYY